MNKSVLLLVASMASTQAIAEDQIDVLDDINLPTDLIASVVVIEDDIQIGDLLAPVSETVAATASDAAAPQGTSSSIFSEIEETESVTQTTSIFSEVTEVAEEPTPDPEPTVASVSASEPLPVPEPEQKPVEEQPEVVAAVAPAASPEPVETQVVEEPAVEEPVEEEPVEEAPEIAVAAPALTLEQEQAINEDEIILGWATAWSNNDVEGYLDYYDEDFRPADPALSRGDWEQLRRKRLQNKEIRIIVSNAELIRSDASFAEVHFTQRYTSKNYKDRVIKAITMRNTPDGWKFLSERTLEKLPFK